MSEKKQQNTHPAEPDVGTAQDVEEMMKKYDRESNTRIWTGIPGKTIRYLCAAFSVYCIWVTLFSTMMPEEKLNLFLGLILILGYLNYPISKKHVRPNYMPWYDILILIAGAIPFFYCALNAHSIIRLAARVTRDPKMVVMAVIAILAYMELCRRCVGIPILCVVGALLIYAFANVRFGKVIYDLFYTTTGMMSTPINVCAKYIVVFIIFGAFLERTGISNFFISLANSIAGASSGGPAKVAVISSALCGMVSGSSVGNTVTTGSVTIPMMKRTGYRPEFAGAVEAAASTGGQIMPPIMGAAAFLMSEYMGIPYGQVALKAILPAVLYFTGIYIAVHLEAKKLGLKGMNPSRPYYLQFTMQATEEEFYRIVTEEAEKDFDPLELVFPKEVPVFEKYDEFVPEELVRKGFALGVLDVESMKKRVRSWARFAHGESAQVF